MHCNNTSANHKSRPSLYRCIWVLLLLLFLSASLLSPAVAQHSDSMGANQPDSSVTSSPKVRSTWVSRPPTGKSAKIQGTLLLLAGGALSYIGLTNMNQEDPCEGISSRNVSCLSNIEEVQTVGAVQLGLGALSGLLGIIRIGAGTRQAKKYADWKRSNLTVSPVVFHNGHQLQYGLSVHF